MKTNETASATARDQGARSRGDAHGPFAVYVAASAAPAEAPRVAAAIASLRAHGFHVTCTWPDIVAKVGDANPRDVSVTARRGWSAQDLAEVDEADAVLFLVPTAPATTRGAWFEAGYAYSEKKHLLFAGDTKQSVFCALGHEFTTDEAAIAHLKLLRGLDELRDADAMDLREKHALTGDVG